jgi:lipopolysaccharide biosynthesis glycosyltransferase
MDGLAVRLMLLGIDLSAEQMAQAHAFLSKAGAKLELMPFALQADRHASGTKWPAAVLARLQLDRHMPGDLDRVLYLDADTLALASLRNLFEADLHGAAVGAVQDVMMSAAQKIAERKRRIGMQPDARYFNSGVMLFDWQQTLRIELLERARRLCAAENDFYAPDQDALNATLNGQWCELDIRWNCQTAFLAFDAAPAIVHFTGARKPWQRGRPWLSWGYAQAYRDLLAETPWSAFYEPTSLAEKAGSCFAYGLRRARRWGHYRRQRAYFAGGSRLASLGSNAF